MKRLIHVQIDGTVRYRSMQIHPGVKFVLQWAVAKMPDATASRMWDIF
jgi:hypothetical protein